MTNPQLSPADIPVVPRPELVNTAAANPLSTAQADALLMEEISVLRARGLTDECILGLFSGFNIDAHPEPSGQHWSIPLNDQLIRLIWGKPLPAPIDADHLPPAMPRSA